MIFNTNKNGYMNILKLHFSCGNIHLLIENSLEYKIETIKKVLTMKIHHKLSKTFNNNLN